MRPLVPLVLLVALVGCRNAPSPGEVRAAEAAQRARRGPPPVIVGTVVDASTRKPLPGVLVRGPAGIEARTDVDGRFVLVGLELGWEGELVAQASGGREGRNRLRALGSGELEVVLFVR